MNSTVLMNSFSQRRKWMLRLLGYALGAGVFAVLIYLGGWQALKAPFQPKIVPFILCFLANGVLFAVSSSRWGVIVDALEGRKVCSHYQYFHYFTLGRFLGQYISQSGSDLVFKPLMLKGMNALPLKRGVMGVLWDKAFDILFVLTLAIPAALLILQWLSPFYSVVLMVLGLALPWTIIVDPRLLAYLTERVLRIARRIAASIPLLRSRLSQSPLEVSLSFKAMNGRTLLIILSLTTLKYVILILRLYLLVLALDLAIPVTAIGAGIPLAQLSLVFAITPGALGLLEGGWYAVLISLGVSQGDITAFLVGQRLYWLLFFAVLAGISYLALACSNLLHRPLRAPKESEDRIL